MKYVIFSDIQGNIQAMQTFHQGMKGFGRDTTICLGDIVDRGESYDDSRVIDLLRELKSIYVVKGNHDELEGPATGKILLPNLQFLRGLHVHKKLDEILAFHSSLTDPGKRLKQPEDVKKELEYINQRFSGIRFVLSGHHHEKKVFSYNPKSGKLNQQDPEKAKLDSDEQYFINPGAIGVYDGIPRSFAVLDTKENKLVFYSLDRLKDMDMKRRALGIFQEDMMPCLDPNAMNAQTVRPMGEKLRKINSDERFEEIFRLIDSYQNANKMQGTKRKEYLSEYTAKLAEEFETLTDNEILDNYSVISPKMVRSFYYPN